AVSGRARSLQREARLAAPARSGQRDQADLGALQQRSDLVELPLASEKRCGGNRQVRLVQRLQRREALRAELEEPLRSAQVLKPVQAEIAHLGAGEVGRRLREEHLSAV